MKRVLKWAFTLLAALSLSLSTLAVALWIRCGWIGEGFNYPLSIRTAGPGIIDVRDLSCYITGGGILTDFATLRRPSFLSSIMRPSHWFSAPTGYLYADSVFARIRLSGRLYQRRSLFDFGKFGAEWTRNSRSNSFGDTQLCIAMPLWFPAAIFLILPLMWEIKHRRRYYARCRVSTGKCGVCGYDLRASPDRCPECGTLTAASSPTHTRGSS